MSENRVKQILNKLIPYIKPDEVQDVLFDVNLDDSGIYKVGATFIVPADFWNSLDDINKAAFAHTTKMKIARGIKNFGDIDIAFDLPNTTFKAYK